MSQTQYDAILEMSDNNGIKNPFETVQKSEVTEYQNDDSLKPFILLVVDRKEEGLKAANDLLQNKMQILSLLVDILILQRICYMANIYQ